MKFYELDLTQILPYGIPVNESDHVEQIGYINDFFIKGFEKYFAQLFTVTGDELMRDYSRSCAATASFEACKFCTDDQLQKAITDFGFKYYSANDHDINAEFLYRLGNVPFGTDDYMTAIAQYVSNSDDVFAEVLYNDYPAYNYGIRFYGDIADSVNTAKIGERMQENLAMLGTAHTRIDEIQIEDTTSEIKTYAAVGAIDVGVYCETRIPLLPPPAQPLPDPSTVNSDNANNPLLLKSSQNGSSVALTKTGTISDVYEVSFDGANWSDATFNNAITLDEDEGFYIRAKANRVTTQSSSNYVQFTMSGAVEAYNNVNSMLSPSDFATTDLSSLQHSDWAFFRLFNGCSALTRTIPLNNTTLVEACYGAMFYNCTGISSAPSLPATVMTYACYSHMFNGCTGLLSAPTLPATTLADNCYHGMFSNCVSLTSAPALTATTLATYCYYEMFLYCTSLTSAPTLNATVLAPNCCKEMFYGCTSLTSAPILNATTLAPSCYQDMFNGCTSLTSAPNLPAIELASDCYTNMFRGCSSLNNIRVAAVNNLGIGLSYWLNGVANSGDFYCDAAASFTENSADGIPSGWTKHATESADAPLFLKAKAGGSTVTLTYVGATLDAYEKSSDLITWTALNLNNAVSVDNNNGIYIRATAARSYAQDTSNYIKFALSGSFEAYNNTNSLLAPTGFNVSNLSSLSNSSTAFYKLFDGCTVLTRAPLLPATTLTSECYSSMFNGCTGLLSAPVLPATTLAASCYSSMFADCSALTSAPTLPAMTLTDYCYTAMFHSCSGLNSAPALPATTLATQCYTSMFVNCTSLTSAPALNATTLANYCYYMMFYGCTGLLSAPALPATTLATGCYNAMFRGCTGLTSAPSLPATTLTNWCYQNMFYGCTGIAIAPTLPATTLAGYCYASMFYNCSSLNEVHIDATDISASSCLSNWLYGVANSGDFYCEDNVAYTVDSASGIPQGWTKHVPLVDDPNKPLYLLSKQNGSTVTLTKTGNVTDVYEKSSDNINWSTLSFDDPVTLNNGEGIYVRISAVRTVVQSTSRYIKLALTGEIEAYHNVNSLLKPTGFNVSDLTAISNSNYAFIDLFYTQAALTKAPLLPNAILTQGCYQYMFNRCTGLTTAPDIPATTLAQSCCQAMFERCTALTSAPAILPATAVETACYNKMFVVCSALTKAPILPATTLVARCYGEMFSGTSVNEVHIAATTLPTASNPAQYCLYNWLPSNGTGDIYCDPNTEFQTGSSGIPTGWTRHNLT